MPQVSSAEIARYEAKQKARPKSARIEQAQNGGFVVTHDSGEYPEPKHAFKNHKEMLSHIKKHFGVESAAEEKAEAKGKK